MVKRPYKVRNSRETKRPPEIMGDNSAHNRAKRKRQKNKSNRKARRAMNYSYKTMTEAINDGRYRFYEATSDRYKPRDVKPVRGLYNPRDGHLFSVRDSWPDSRQDGE